MSQGSPQRGEKRDQEEHLDLVKAASFLHQSMASKTLGEDPEKREQRAGHDEDSCRGHRRTPGHHPVAASHQPLVQ